jgi:hypothetical protein
MVWPERSKMAVENGPKRSKMAVENGPETVENGLARTIENGGREWSETVENGLARTVENGGREWSEAGRLISAGSDRAHRTRLRILHLVGAHSHSRHASAGQQQSIFVPDWTLVFI